MMNNTERNFLTPESHEQLDLQGRDVIYSCTGAVFKHLTGSPIAPPAAAAGRREAATDGNAQALLPE